MEELGLGDEAVTTIVQAEVESCDGQLFSIPFIRICSTDKEQIMRILVALEFAGINEYTEWLVLGGFKSKVKPKVVELGGGEHEV
jgi:hypothetical protein